MLPLAVEILLSLFAKSYCKLVLTPFAKDLLVNWFALL